MGLQVPEQDVRAGGPSAGLLRCLLAPSVLGQAVMAVSLWVLLVTVFEDGQDKGKNFPRFL